MVFNHWNSNLNRFEERLFFFYYRYYYIIEDGVLSELGYGESHHGGPLKAIEEIINNNDEYKIDRSWCDFFGQNATFNPNGYLIKK